MKDKIVINTNLVEQQGLTLTNFLLGLAFMNTTESIGDVVNGFLEDAENVQMYTSSIGVVSQQMQDKINYILANSENQDDTLDYEAIAKEMRELFPKGMKYINGKPVIPWRESTVVISKRLKKFNALYGHNKYTAEQIIRATKEYVDSFPDKSDSSMRVLKYFIIKDETKSGERDQQCDLLNFLENLGKNTTNINYYGDLKV